MFGLINNLFTLVLVLLIGIPLLAFFAYFAAYFVQGLIGGPMWLWMIIIAIIGIGTSVEELNKAKKESQV